MNKIGVVGCGWLGLPLSKHLATKYSRVKGTSRNTIKLEEMQHANVDAFLIDIESTIIKGNFKAFIRDLDTLVIGLNANKSEEYFDKIELLSRYVTESDVKKIIFLSTISVYDNINKVVDESDEINEHSLYIRVENIFKNNNRFLTTVLRLGGLIGEDRHPIKHLSGRNIKQNPKTPVNLVHLNDCINVITKVIEQDIWNETFNVVYPYHPTKEEYYTAKAREYNLEAPIYDDSVIFKGKVVSSSKLMERLKFNFSHEI